MGHPPTDFPGATDSICPQCLKRIPAARVRSGSDIYLQKTCPDHGTFETVIWRGQPSFESWNQGRSIHGTPETCPFACGLCAHHLRQSCCVLLEVTQRCNQRCPVCFADAGATKSRDPSLARIGELFQALLDQGGPFNIQLSGGEPTLRDDLPDIIAMGRSMGFPYFQINTNGLRIAHDKQYLSRLKEAGLSVVFLQFDGTKDAIYRQLRGKELLAEKEQAILNCKDSHLGVVLVPTIVPGVNSDDIGSIITFALKGLPCIRGVHFQPISYFGRYPRQPADNDRITLPEIVSAIENQTHGRFKADQFAPGNCEHPLCSFHGDFTIMPDGRISSWTGRPKLTCSCKTIGCEDPAAKKRNFVARRWGIFDTEGGSCCEQSQTIRFDGWDDLVTRIKTHSFCITGMAFQDAWNLDLQRLQSCCLHVVNYEGDRIPFCAYNLTNSDGKPLYRKDGIP